MAATVVGMTAQVNAPEIDGYLSRGTLMYRDQNYQGAIDQLTQLKRMSPDSHQAEEADFYIALSRLYRGELSEARQLLEAFVGDYPSSSHMLTALMSIADCDFYEGEYEQALARYNAIPESALDLAAAKDYRYRKAYSLMKLDDWDAAMNGFASLRSTKRYSNAARFYQGYIYYAQGDYSKAKELLSSVNTSTAPGNRADYYLTQIAFTEGDYDKALSMARKAMNTVAEFTPEMQRIAGESLYNLGDEAEAVTYLEKYVAATNDPKPSALYILGVSQYKSGDLDEAVSTLGPVTACDDAMGQSAYLYIGQAYLKQGNVNSALLALEKAYRMDYDKKVQETAFYNYAVAKMEGGRTPFGSSVTMFEDFLRRYPDSRYAPSVQEYLVTGYMTDNNYEKALASIERIKRPSSAILTAKQRVLYILGSRDLAAGNVSQALKRFQGAKALSSQDKAMATECDLWIGDCYYRQGKYAQASKAYSDYLRYSGANSSNRMLATYDLGYSRFGEKRYSDARQNFEKVVKQPGNLGQDIVADSYNRIGDCHYYASAFSEAAANYDKAYSLNPAAGDYALFQKAMMRGLARDYKGKLEIIDDMMSRYPTSGLMPSALLEKAESYVALNRADDAVKVYRDLVKRYPTTSQGRNGYLQLAITLMNQGNRRQAIDTYKEVISSYPTSEEARVASDDLKRIYADDGNLDDYAKFIASVPNAPKLEAAEMDELTFRAAEKAYLNDNAATSKLRDYVSRYPGGQYEPQALSYLATAAVNAGNEADALQYATMITERYPDSEAAEDALAIKGEAEYAAGNGEQALATFRKLESRASASRNIHAARLGIMRVSRDLGKYDDVVDMADRMLASTAIPSTQKNEVRYSRAYALAQLGKGDEAVKEWQQLAEDMDDLYGAKSAYYLAQYHFDNGAEKKARTEVERLVDSNTPHQYWLARGFILLSDIYRKQGNQFEADEYLKSLKENYPGEESDIFMMIDQRLK